MTQSDKPSSPTSTDTKIEEILLKVLLVWKQDYPKPDGDNGLLMDEYFERLEYTKKEATTALKTLLTSEKNKARIDELEKIMNGQKTIRSYITGDGGEEQIVTYEFANTEIKDRLAKLREME